MLLSEAIRLGAMLRPQGFRGLFLDTDGRTCALGAACEACGIPIQDPTGISNYSGIEARFPYLLDGDLRNRIIIWNDVECLSREKIADRVEEIERERGLIPAPVAEEAEVVHLSRGA